MARPEVGTSGRWFSSRAASPLSSAERSRRRGRGPNPSRPSDYLFLAPALGLVVIFLYYAIFFNLDGSLYNWNGMSPSRVFIGIDNYLQILGDPTFLHSLINTVIFAVATVISFVTIGFTLSALMSTGIRFKGFYSTLIIFPCLLATVVIATTGRKILGGTQGDLNALLSTVGLDGLTNAWLADPSTALPALAVVHVWHWIGFSFLLYYAALTLVNKEVVEAALLDGASTWQVMWRVLFPMCRPTTFALLILSSIAALKVFDIVYLTTRGGPGQATEVLSTYILRKAILDSQAGYASAMAVVLVVIAMGVTATLLWLSERRAFRV